MLSGYSGMTAGVVDRGVNEVGMKFGGSISTSAISGLSRIYSGASNGIA